MDFLFVELPETVKLGSFLITISNTNFWYKQHKGFNLLMGFFSFFHFPDKYSVSEHPSPNLVPYKRRNQPFQTLRCQHRFGSRAAECGQCLKCPERCRDTHIMLLILSRFCVTWSLVGSKTKTYKLQVFRSFGHISLHRSTRSVGGNLFDILRNQAFSLRQRLFSGKILRSSRRKSSEQFWSPVWTARHSSAVDKMTQMCLSVPIRVGCGPFCSRY